MEVVVLQGLLAILVILVNQGIRDYRVHQEMLVTLEQRENLVRQDQ
jgi:hypothetical protein